MRSDKKTFLIEGESFVELSHLSFETKRFPTEAIILKLKIDLIQNETSQDYNLKKKK